MIRLLLCLLLLTGCSTYQPVLSPWTIRNYARIQTFCHEQFKHVEKEESGALVEQCYFNIHLWEKDNKHYERFEQ